MPRLAARCNRGKFRTFHHFTRVARCGAFLIPFSS